MFIVWNLPSIEKIVERKWKRTKTLPEWKTIIYTLDLIEPCTFICIQSWKRFDCFSWCLSEPDLFNLFIALLFLNINKLNIMIVRTLASGKITMLFRIISKLSRHQRLAVTGSKLTCQTVITWNSDRLV